MSYKIRILFCSLIVLVLAAPVSVSALQLDRIKTLFLNKDYARCINEGEKLLAGLGRNEKGIDELYYYLGLSYLKQGNFLKSSDIFEIIIVELKSRSFSEQALLGLGDSYLFQRELSRAEKSYNDLLSQYPNTELKAAAYYRLSQVAKAGNDNVKAESYLSRLKKEFPQSPEAKTTTDIVTESAMQQTNVRGSKVLSGSGYAIQVGAFSSRTNADKLAVRLENKGFRIFVVDGTSGGKPIYKVRAGPFASMSEAKEQESSLKNMGLPTKIVP